MNDPQLIVLHSLVTISFLALLIVIRLADPNSKDKRWGYKTSWSRKSQETWAFANRFASSILIWVVAGGILVQICTILLLDSLTATLVSCSAFMLGYYAVMIMTEVQLRKRFDKEGKPKLNYGRF